MTTYGLLIFDGAGELDFTGPREVFTASRMLRDHADNAVLIAERPDAISCRKGMRVLPGHTRDDHPPLDVLVAPGGAGTRSRPWLPISTGWTRCRQRPGCAAPSRAGNLAGREGHPRGGAPPVRRGSQPGSELRTRAVAGTGSSRSK